MTKPTLVDSRISAGIWQGAIAGLGAATPQINITHLGQALAEVAVDHDSTRDLWRVSVPIPSELINDGVQVFAVSTADGTRLGSFSLLAGNALDDDLRAEIGLLRAELDLLKQSFRKHCADQQG